MLIHFHLCISTRGEKDPSRPIKFEERKKPLQKDYYITIETGFVLKVFGNTFGKSKFGQDTRAFICIYGQFGT